MDSSRALRDGASALSSQIADLFSSLQQGSNRQQRYKEGIEALLEMLGKHSREIQENETLQQLLFRLVVDLGNTCGMELGMKAMCVIVDVNVMDHDAKRASCVGVIVQLLEKCKDEANGEILLEHLKMLLVENMFSAQDVAQRIFEAGMSLFRSTAFSVSRPLGVRCITIVVTMCPQFLKSVKGNMDQMRTSMSPSFLIREMLNGPTHWYRQSFAHIMVELIRHGVFEVSQPNIEEIVQQVDNHLTDTEENTLGGVLVGIIEFSTVKQLAQAYGWSKKKIWHLFEMSWEVFSQQIQRLAIAATLVACQMVGIEAVDDVRAALCRHLPLQPGYAAQALLDLTAKYDITLHYVSIAEHVAQFITSEACTMPPAEVLPLLQALIRVQASQDAIGARCWDAVRVLISQGKHQSAAMVMSCLHDVSQHQDEILGMISLADMDPMGQIGMVAVLHQPQMLPQLGRMLSEGKREVRLEAAQAVLKICSRLIDDQQSNVVEGPTHARRLDNIVTSAVEKLLDIAVADVDSSVRFVILNGLSQKFDGYLSLPDHLEALFMARFDIESQNRRLALSLLSRLLPCHPACVQPPLMRFQDYALKELETKDATISEVITATNTLRIVAANSALLLPPKQIENAVVDRFQKYPFTSRNLTLDLLRLLKVLFDYGGASSHCDPVHLVHSLTPLALSSHTSLIRVAALETLASAVRTLNVAVDSALFSDIYRLCGRISGNEAKEDDEVRKAAVVVLSVVGAVNPVKIRSVTRLLEQEDQEVEENRDLLLQHKPHPRAHPHMAERYPSIVLYLLVKIMQTVTDPRLQQDALRCAYDTLKGSPANQKTILLSQFVPQLRSWLAEPDKSYLYEFILKILTDLSSLLRQFKDSIPQNIGIDILKSLKNFCELPHASQKPLNALVVELLDELARALPAQDIREHRWAVEYIHRRLSRDKEDASLIVRVVKSLEAFSSFLHEKDMRHVIPHVLECVDVPPPLPAPTSFTGTMLPEQNAILSTIAAVRQVNTACYDFFTQIISRHPTVVKDLCAQIVHTSMKFIEESTEEEDHAVALNALAQLLSAVGRPAVKFIEPIQRILDVKKFPQDYFKQLMQAAANGAAKVKLPPAKPEEPLNADLPVTITSHIATLTRTDFETELKERLEIEDKDFEVLSISHPGGQTVINFRFVANEGIEQKIQQFARRAVDSQSHLRRTLGIVTIEQKQQQKFRVSNEFLAQVSAYPEARKRKKEVSWMSWLHSVTSGMLKNSPHPALRVLSTFNLTNNPLAKEMFPFAVSAVLDQVDAQQRQSLVTLFSQSLAKAPYDIRQILYSLSEFLESERGEKKEVLIKVTKTVTCNVERETPDQKFGINYDQEARGIIVTKLAPDGPGARAGVPQGGVLQSVNGQKVRAVNEIPAMIKGLTKLQLVFHVTEEQRQVPERRALMDLPELAKVAFESQLHAKAIYFNEVLLDQLIKGELDLGDNCILTVVERLIEFYNHLGLTMDAKGIGKRSAGKVHDAGTLEQLNWWSEALELYRKSKHKEDGSINFPSFLGMLRCHEAQGDIQVLQGVVEEHWESLDAKQQADVARYRASAAMSLGDWEIFDQTTSSKQLVDILDTVEKCAYYFRKGKYDALLKLVKEERDSRFERFSESFDESYIRCYDILVELQHLSHFEELVQYQTTASEDRKLMLRNVWRRRATQMNRRPKLWKTIIAINSLVLSQEEDQSNRVDCVQVCSKHGWQTYAEFVLFKLLGGTPSASQPLTQLTRDPSVIHAFLKHKYNAGNKQESLKMLSEVLENNKVNPGDANCDMWGKCWLLLGEWNVQSGSADTTTAIDALKRASELSPKSPSAFHSLGIVHYERSRDVSLPIEVRHQHSIAAVTALFSAVQLASSEGKNSVMQDMLRILAIWFERSNIPALNDAVRAGITVIPDHAWLRVIPQLIARVGINSYVARRILGELLVRVGSRYPHAFIYPLTVSEKSTEAVRRKMAENVLEGIRQSCDQLVKEASLISNELVRMAILWPEKWVAALQAAATKQQDPVETLRILAPLYEELEQAVTPNEKNFEKSFGQTLKRAKTALLSKAIDQAWQLLKQVYSNLMKIAQERKLQMNDVSPVLDGIHKSIVAVPGTFDPSKQLISIHKFLPKIVVMTSKQKPRRFGLEGSDGKQYRFLLKGHEDLRQDERVMQFLDLINAIFASDSASISLDLSIPRYAVVPLTDNVGLIGWVENTETIYRMLEARRQEYNVSVYEEVNLIIKKGGLTAIEEYHKKSKSERKDLLAHAMRGTPSDELTRIIWDKNDTCEQWLEYRRLYAHTLAIMSMVGYVLGLGDRHLNNLMLQQGGSVVHIDFGDCFEVAMHRALYGEAVPFRLTRLLVAALGVTGVDGVYRHTCEHVMNLLRRHKENLLSVLEAFIFDPLINWKLVAPQQQPEGTSKDPKDVAAAHEAEELAAAEEEKEAAAAAVLLGEVKETKQPALSCTVRNRQIINRAAVAHQEDEQQELRNQQADVALHRVHQKLSGLDFGGATGSATATSGGSQQHQLQEGIMRASEFFGAESLPNVSVGGALLASYLQQRQQLAAEESLDVPQQVDRLIYEAMSLDNLAEAYITGWAPFW